MSEHRAELNVVISLFSGLWMSWNGSGIEFVSTFLEKENDHFTLSSGICPLIWNDVFFQQVLSQSILAWYWSVLSQWAVASFLCGCIVISSHSQWKMKLGFYCLRGLQLGEQPHFARCLTDEPQNVVCFQPGCGGVVLLEDKHKCWFTVSERQYQQQEYSRQTAKKSKAICIIYSSA